ncbi:MAG: preprotein translocase subunit YajC [Deltaproteobacteria bacterium]|nr:preprotein translocase subunit YajC [Deltaproteobacteria bacterium]
MMRKFFLINVVALFCLLPACAAPGETGRAGSAGIAAGQGVQVQQISNFDFVFNTVAFVLMGVWGYYFLVFRPMTNKENAQKKFLASLKKGDEVITSGGLLGRIVSVADEFAHLEIAPNVRVKVQLQSLKPRNVQVSNVDTNGAKVSKVSQNSSNK